MTSTDEYSAQHQAVEDAEATEEMFEGRPFEIRAATTGLFAELRADKPGFLSALFLFVVLVAGFGAPLLAPYGPVEGNPSTSNIAPVWDGGTWSHVFGTDSQGYDVLSRLMYGSRTTMLIGFAVVAAAGLFGVVVGLIAGYRGGRTDRWLMRWVDVQVAFPGLLIALIMIAVLGASISSLIFVLAFNGWMVYARMTRGVVLSAKERPYVEAAEMIGCKPRRVMFNHILPNLTSSLVTLAVLEFARIILAEATLSFLGLGLQFPEVSLGVMANTGRDAFFSLPRLAIIPGVAITLIVLSVNFLASWLRVASDPIEREKRHAAGAVSAAATATALGSDGTRCGSTEAPVLEVEHLQVDFHTRRGRVQAIRDVSFTIGRGETLGLVGESGSGKSVTAQALLGMIELPGQIVGGDVRWKGESLVRGPNVAATIERIRGREIAMVFQDPMTSLDPVFTIGSQMTEVLRRHRKLDRKAARTRAVELLDMVGIANPAQRVKQYPFEMSGGMRQRVLIAMALACEPELLVADEPTTALDVTIQAQILDLLADLQRRLNVAVLLITHDLGVVAGVCDRAAVMYAGKIVEDANATDLYSRPAHPYSVGLLRSTPRVDVVLDRLVAIDGAPPDLRRPPVGCGYAPRCPHAADQCRKEQPALEPLGEHSGRSVACFWAAAQLEEVTTT